MNTEEQKIANNIASKKYRQKIKSNPEKNAEAKEKRKHQNERWKEKLKSDSIKYEEYLLKERERSKNRRKKISSDPILKEKNRKYQKEYAEKNKEKLKNYPSRSSREYKETNLSRRYNITIEQYNKLLEEQNGLCKICNKIPDKICVDHCHKTSIVRGLLCNKCNTALGLLSEDINVLQNAILYLQINKTKD